MINQEMQDMKAHRKIAAPPARASLLVVEDEQDLQDLLRYNLEREGFRVACAGSGKTALQMVRTQSPDLVILDLMLPDVDGLEICRTIRADPVTARIPILMLTAKNEEADVVTGLEMGADDYLTKPFSPRVLLARVKAVLRRRQEQGTGNEVAATEPEIQLADLTISPERHEVVVAGQTVELTATEFRLLYLLASRPGRVFVRQQIIDEMHGQFAAVTERSVDVQVVMLRRKLGARGESIQTVRGVGYRFKD